MLYCWTCHSINSPKRKIFKWRIRTWMRTWNFKSRYQDLSMIFLFLLYFQTLDYDRDGVTKMRKAIKSIHNSGNCEYPIPKSYASHSHLDCLTDLRIVCGCVVKRSQTMESQMVWQIQVSSFFFSHIMTVFLQVVGIILNWLFVFMTNLSINKINKLLWYAVCKGNSMNCHALRHLLWSGKICVK